MNCIEIENLTFSFSEKEIVLNNVNLQVPQGAIYGFLGSNGAGKTTTLRLILGLLEKQQGSIKVFGKDFKQNRVEILRNIGSLIESPSLYSHLNAKENLNLLQVIYQCPKSRIQEVLKLVNLTDTGKKKVGSFSLGMKQRLAIAVALLHSPQLLILDEPTNGLDPNGIIEIRELLKKLNEEHNISIIISSHLLSEIEKLVTHIGIISKGNLIFEGKLEELHSKQKSSSIISFKTNDLNKTAEIFKANNITSTIVDEEIQILVVDNKMVSHLNKQLVNSNIDVYQISEQKDDLESIFINLTQN